MSRKQGFGVAVGFCAGLAVAGLLFLFGPGSGSRVEASSTPPNGEHVVRYIRERFGVPDSERLTLQPFREAAYPGYYETTVVVDNGKDKRESHISVSADGRYLILSDFLPLGSNPEADITRQITEVFKIPASVKLSVGPFERSPFPGFLQTTITARSPERTQTQKYFVTRDKRFLVLGGIFNMGVDPRRQALRTLKLTDQPYIGSPDAPVTIVEFADLECPTCAREHEFIEKELMPKYRGKVRLVFKEFPLLQIHQWAFTGALACQCAYQIDPSKYVAYRTSIFEHQANITAPTARDLLLYYGQQVGLDRLKLASCLDSKASLPRVEENLREGRELGVDRTPTFYINGRLLVGGGPPDAFYREVDEALRAAK